jgi:hypothetical protein
MKQMLKLNLMGENMRLLKNKRGDLESMIKVVGWIVFFGIALVALYFLINKFTG